MEAPHVRTLQAYLYYINYFLQCNFLFQQNGQVFSFYEHRIDSILM